jgi:hypothetical protein
MRQPAPGQRSSARAAGAGAALERARDAVGDVADVRVVAAGRAVAEDRDLLPREEELRELVDRHVGPLARAVGVEEPQRGDVESVQQVEHPPHRLGRLLRRGVGRQRRRRRIGLPERRVAARPVDGRRRRQDERAAFRPPRRLEEDRRAADVDVGVDRGVVDRRTHARLRREVDDPVDAVLVEQTRHERRIADVALDEAEAGELRQLGDVAPLDRRIVVRVEVVEADDLASRRGEARDDVRPDEARCAGDEDAAQSFTTFARTPSFLVALRVSTTSFASFTTFA